MKAALVLCPSWDEGNSACALPTLAAGLAARGHEAGIYDLNWVFRRMEAAGLGERARPRGNLAPLWCDQAFVRRRAQEWSGYLESFVDRVLGEGPRMIGFSTYFSNALMSLEVARLFKRRDPGVVTVFGGSQCLNLERCLSFVRDEAVDAVVYGEGDLVLPALADSLSRGGRLEPMPGVLLRRDPSTWKAARAQPPSDLDSLPAPDFQAHRFGPVRPKVINTCRGCVRRCDFCSEWRQMGFRQRSARATCADLRRQLQVHPESTKVMFGDSLINGVPREFESLCDRMIAEGLKIEWSAYAIVRPEMTRAALEKARASGCRWLFYGVESGSENVRRRITKDPSAAVIGSVLRDTAAAGIAARVGCIAGHPAETEADFEKTLEFVEREAANVSLLCLSVFQTLELENQAEEYGLVAGGDYWFWRNRDGSNTFPIRIERVRRLARRAAACGVALDFDGVGAEGVDRRCEEHLERYRAS